MKKVKSLRIKKIVKTILNYLGALRCALQLLIFNNRFIIFDTPSHGNIGDQAILLAEMEYLGENFGKRKVIDVPAECVDIFLKFFESSIKNSDIVFIHGGGFLGSIWGDEIYSKVIEKFTKNEIIVFPQTIFYEDTEYGRKKFCKEQALFDKKNVKIFVREQHSYDFFQQKMLKVNKQNCVLVPDIVLSYNTNINSERENKIVTCFRNDKEKVFSFDFNQQINNLIQTNGCNLEQTDMCVNYALRALNEKKKTVDEKLKQFSTAKFVITDRLHCMIFCTLTGTPCIAMDNSSKKVEGVYEKWLKDLNYIVFCENENDALQKVAEWIEDKEIKAVKYSQKDLQNAFKPLTEIIQKYLA